MNSVSSVQLLGKFAIVLSLIALSATGDANPEGSGDPSNETSDPTESFFSTIATSLATHAGTRVMDRLLDWLFDGSQSTDQYPNYAPTLEATNGDNKAATATVAYRLYSALPGGSFGVAEPSATFQNGERILIRFSTNLPGYVVVTNRDAEGQTQDLGVWPVSGGTVSEVGVFEFYGAAGTDILTLAMYPCVFEANMPGGPHSQHNIGGVQRRLDIRPDMLLDLPRCPKEFAIPIGTVDELESLRRVKGHTSYAIGKGDVQKHYSLARPTLVTRVQLRHR